MAIKPIQVQALEHEIGKIRIGEKKKSSSGKEYPSARDTFRFTSADRAALEALQSVYGGEIRPWERSLELDTKADTIHALLSVEGSVDSFYEQWAGDACSHRCNGETCEFTDAKGIRTEIPCECDPDPEERACKYTTRLKVILPYSRRMMKWTLVSRGFYFPGELATFLANVSMFGAKIVPITIRIDPRESKVRGGPAKKFIVPVVDVDSTPPDLTKLLAGPIMEALASLARAEREIALAAGSAVAALPAESYIDQETGERVELVPTATDTLPAPSRSRKDIAQDIIKGKGWHGLEHKPAMTRFKNRCETASPRIDWVELLIEAAGNGVDSLDAMTELADSRDQNQPRATGLPPLEPDPFADPNPQSTLEEIA